MTKNQQLEKHVETLLEVFPNAKENDPLKLHRMLRRLEKQAHKIAEASCNEQNFDWEWADEKCKEILDQVKDILQAGDVDIFINFDPRGYALKIEESWMKDNPNRIPRDWGGYGILAPEIRR